MYFKIYKPLIFLLSTQPYGGNIPIALEMNDLDLTTCFVS